MEIGTLRFRKTLYMYAYSKQSAEDDRMFEGDRVRGGIQLRSRRDVHDQQGLGLLGFHEQHSTLAAFLRLTQCRMYRSRSGASELPAPVLERADMEEILDACLRTTAYLAVSRDHHKVVSFNHRRQSR